MRVIFPYLEVTKIAIHFEETEGKHCPFGEKSYCLLFPSEKPLSLFFVEFAHGQ